MGHEETYSTIQIDFHLPNRFDSSYIGADGKQHRPVMIHRAIISTMERMVSYLIELYRGAFPVWLAPVQAIVLPITDRQNDYARKVLRATDRGRYSRRAGRPQRKSQFENSRSATAEDSLHAGGGCAGSGGGAGGGAEPEARRPGRAGNDGIHRRHSEAGSRESHVRVIGLALAAMAVLLGAWVYCVLSIVAVKRHFGQVRHGRRRFAVPHDCSWLPA